MRSEAEILALIISVAEANKNIRAVLLNGSRADTSIPKDAYQDFDICFIVTDINPFIKDHSWIDVFGERIIQQLPDEMIIGERSKHSFAYLMLFADGNRIDLTLVPQSYIQNNCSFKEPTVLLSDKDGFFKSISFPVCSGFIQSPSQKEFADCCNEFWWVSTYVIKGLFRNEIIYAKQMLEVRVRKMLLQMIEWLVGIKTGFIVSVGSEGKRLRKHLPDVLYQKILSTYSDSTAENIWEALLLMTEIFNEVSLAVASGLNLAYNEQEEKNTIAYLKKQHRLYTSAWTNYKLPI